ncbi:hypothetical protein ERJ75_000936400 [Trypanosoma vivax]|uniref:Uncharacterized protein n=1 Tax=Trypanosoma vivax (strain Y486) TaxID=1055687 RepID=G0U470_TRYVY|nr:hypothetical protein ERJ75_000936400 [Trypanosoma vivax]CCC52232.1 conserved hypothetical protein [Trypanosoma vivax Y486]
MLRGTLFFMTTRPSYIGVPGFCTGYRTRKRSWSTGRAMQRDSLLMELDRASSVSASCVTEDYALQSSKDYIMPSPHAAKFVGAAVAGNALTDEQSQKSSEFKPPGSISSSSGKFSKLGSKVETQELPSVSNLEFQHRSLREVFEDAGRQCIRLRKDRQWLQEEQRVFQKSHGRAPTGGEVTPFVDVALAPVAALKLLKHLPSHSSTRELVEHSLLLQQSVRQNKLVQSNDQTMFRCLRCFHIYVARPRALLRDKVEHSWLEYDALRTRATLERKIARCPSLRKKITSVGRRRSAEVESPRCCPLCRSVKAQWVMEYVHHRTHS